MGSLFLYYFVFIGDGYVKNHSYKIDLRNPSSHVLWHCCYSRVCFFLGERKAYLLVKGQSDSFVF